MIPDIRFFSFLSKVQANEPPAGSKTALLWREIPVYRTCCTSLKEIIKIPLIRRFQEGSAHPCSAKARPLRKQTPTSEPCLTYIRVSEKRKPLSRSPTRNPWQRDAPFLQPTFIHFSKLPVNETLVTPSNIRLHSVIKATRSSLVQRILPIVMCPVSVTAEPHKGRP